MYIKKEILFFVVLVVGISNSSFTQISFDIKHTVTESFLQPTSIFPADIDKDGKIDIIAGSKYDSIVFLKNTGEGIFDKPQTICTSLDYIQHISACDLDKDGDIDILSGSKNDSTFAWIENLGNETFSVPHMIYNNAYIPKYISGCDFDNDNDIDVVATTQNRILWFENNGDCTFKQPVTIANATSETIRIMDYDKDGDNDVFTVAYNENEEKVFWYENGGDNTTFTKKSLNIPFNFIETGDLSVYDINNDQKTDIILSFHVSWSNKITIFINEGDSFSNYITMSAAVPRFILVDDFDKDGDGDILATTFDRIEYHENINFTFPEKTYFGNINELSDIDNSDIDNDSDIDVICAVKDGQSIYWMENLLLEITKQPTDKTVCLYQDTVFMSVETNDAKQYQWETKEVGYTYFYPLENNDMFWDVKKSVLKIIRPDFNIDGQEFRCKVSNYYSEIISDTATIKIFTDSLPPVLETKNTTLYLRKASSTKLFASQVTSALYDDCGYIDTTLSKSVFDCTDIGENTILVTAADGTGNSTSEYVTVTVRDTVSPDIVFQPETVRFFSANKEFKIESGLADPDLIIDNCGISSVTNSITGTETLEGAVFPAGNTEVEWTATDINGNISKFKMNVLVTDYNEYNVYPNPFTDYLIVTQKYEGDYSVNIFDLTGKTVYQVSGIRKQWFPLDLGFLNKGMYIAKIFSGDKETTLKIIKTK